MSDDKRSELQRVADGLWGSMSPELRRGFMLSATAAGREQLAAELDQETREQMSAVAREFHRIYEEETAALAGRIKRYLDRSDGE